MNKNAYLSTKSFCRHVLIKLATSGELSLRTYNIKRKILLIYFEDGPLIHAFKKEAY